MVRDSFGACMRGYKTFHRKKVLILFLGVCFCMLLLAGRLTYLMVFQSAYYTQKALMLHERERSIKAARGEIRDRNGTVLAANKTVCTISVIHSQIKDPEAVIELLCRELSMDEETVRKRVEKVSSIERIKSNVEKETGDRIRKADLGGIKVDEDYKRYYPYDTLASKVLGFTGADNQGIIGLEVKYEDALRGQDGTIYTITDARGVEIDAQGESRKEPVKGHTLQLTLDRNIQAYATMLATQAMLAKEAEGVSILCMNPQNGEIYACVNVPEFNLNAPYDLTDEYISLQGEKYMAGKRIFFDSQKKQYVERCPQNELIAALQQANIPWVTGDDILPAVLTQASTDTGFRHRMVDLIRSVLQMRSSNGASGEDYINSPVMDLDGHFFDTRAGIQDLPLDADANGAYHIALKGKLLLERIRDGKNTAIKNTDWLYAIQEARN